MAKIKLFLTDLDGVLTDGRVYYTAQGEFAKCFHIHDGMGLMQVGEAGIKTGIITSEKSDIVERRAERLNIDYLYMGKSIGQKLPTIVEHCEKENLSLAEVAYMGDDINCHDLLMKVGHPACPADAQDIIKKVPNIYIARKCGGQGALREWINILLEKQTFAL